jgi:hypothetical protein
MQSGITDERVGLWNNDVEDMGVQRYETRRKDEQGWIRILGEAEGTPRETLLESDKFHEHCNRKLVK